MTHGEEIAAQVWLETTERHRLAKNIDAALKQERCNGIVAGLEMAEKFLSMTKNRSDVESMIRAAKLTAQGTVG